MSKAFDDELTQIKDYFYVGNFQRTQALLEELLDLAARDGVCLAEEVKTFNLRSELGAGRSVSEAGVIQAFQLFRKASNEEEQSRALETLRTSISQASGHILMASALCEANQKIEAMSLCEKYPDSLEMWAMKAMIYFGSWRWDLAEDAIRELMAEDDSSLAHFMGGLSSLMTGNYEEAYLIFSDLESQFCPTSESSRILLQNKAVTHMYRSNFTDALKDLEEAIEIGSSPSLTQNAMACLLHTGNFQGFSDLETKYGLSKESSETLKKLDQAIDSF